MSTLSKEARITVLTLLKNYYDEEIFKLLVKQFYDPDPLVSEAAIRASGSLGNETAISHLYTMIEKGRSAQRIAAIQALKAIRAPSATGMLIKYFAHFPEEDLRTEILRAINTISPTAQQVMDLNAAVYADAKQPEAVKCIAAEAIVEAERYPLLRDTLARVQPAVQHAALTRMLQTGTQEVFDLPLESLGQEALGAYLCVCTLKVRNPQGNFVLETLQKGDRRTISSFLHSLSQFQGRLRYPTRVFRLLLIIPYVDAEMEALVGDFLKKIVVEVKSTSPQLLSEFSVVASAHLDTVFAKIRKNYISFRGVSRKEDLLAVILAALLEKHATPAILAEVQAFFKDDGTGGRTPPVAQLRSLLAAAPREEQNRLEACIPLFALRDKLARLPVFNQVSRVDLNRPFFLRRLNRLIRAAGTLEIRSAAKKIQEILDFARAERLNYIEETSIVTLCQLLTRSIIEQSREFFHEPASNVRSLNGYIRGARFIPAKIMAGQLVQILQSSALTPPSRALAVETLESMDLAGMMRTLQPILRVFDLPYVPEPIKLRLGDIIAKYADASVGHPALDLTSHATVAGRRSAVRILKALALRGGGPSVENVTNQLYHLLEDPDRSVKVEAVLALLAMGDDYAAQIVGDFVQAGASEVLVELLAGMPRPLTREAFRVVVDMIGVDNRLVQETLRGLLSDISQSGFAEELRRNLLTALSVVPGEVAHPPQPEPARGEETTTESVLEQKKLEFKFRRANTQNLTVFFIDIAGFTEKSTSMDMSSLMKIVRAFEEIVGSCVEADRGTIVKKLGDGMLAVFKHPLHATSAALAVQKKIGEYNATRVGQEKFQARIGLNTGPVIRKDNDIFGEVVNVAARMQSAATPGDVLLTESTYQAVREYARCTELGKIQAKGIKDPITAYSPQAITVDLARFTGGGARGPAPAGGQRDASLERLKESMFVPLFTVPDRRAAAGELAATLKTVFTDLTRAVEEISADYHEEYEIKKYLQEKWDLLMGRM